MSVGDLRRRADRPTCQWYASPMAWEDTECGDPADVELVRDGTCGYEILTLCRDHADDFGPSWADETWEWTGEGWRRTK